MFDFATLLSSVVGIASHLVIVIVIATVGRRQRPDAYRWLLGWAIGSLTWAALGDGLRRTLPGGTNDMGTILSLMAGITLLETAVNVVLTLAFLRGFVAIVQPSRRVVADASGPYR